MKKTCTRFPEAVLQDIGIAPGKIFRFSIVETVKFFRRKPGK